MDMDEIWIRISIILLASLLALIPANMAKTRNRSFWKYYILSFLVPISIPLNIIILAIIGHKKEIKEEFDLLICKVCSETTPKDRTTCICCGAIIE